MLNKLSPWFNRDEHPIRNGLYEVQYWSGHQEKREWRGLYWMFRRDTETHFHFPSSQIRFWRGTIR